MSCQLKEAGYTTELYRYCITYISFNISQNTSDQLDQVCAEQDMMITDSESTDSTNSDVDEEGHVSSDGSESDDTGFPDDSGVRLSTISSLSTLIFKLVWFLFYWQSIFSVTENAMKSMFCFLKYFIKVLGLTYHNVEITNLSEQIPLTVKTAEKLLGIDLQSSGVIEYVVCPKCDSVYSYKNCIEIRANGTTRGKCCYHIKYPHHPYPSKRQPCNAELLKSVVTIQGRSLKPIKTYCYYPLHLSMQRLALRPGFLGMCERWRLREQTMPGDYLGDIYDGQIWKQFRSDFLALPYSYLLCLNVDWFQPYKHIQYSVGAIYVTVQNLPREERFKSENIILVGILPGPKEPSLSIDSFMQPMIEELNEMFSNGFSVLTPYNFTIKMRLAIGCVTCDIPATRKVCGFLSHNANLGCNKCYKQFSANDCDPSLFNRDSWRIRTAAEHRADCRKISLEVTKTKMRAAESQYGVRFCALLKLPYYDPIRFVAIDLMHNLLLGTAKHMFCTWVEVGLLTDSNLRKIDLLINKFSVPSNVGRLPVHIKSNYLSFKASQWSSWTLLYSPVLLKDILPDEHYKCWLLFVRATAILSQRTLHILDVDTADKLLENFCKTVERIYGRDYCTPNMHLHLHIKDTILDFGPAHATWCFSFERYNKLLGSVSTNNKSIEHQFMTRFLKTQMIQSLATSIEDDNLLTILPNRSNEESISRPISYFTTSDSDLVRLLKLSHSTLDLEHCNYTDREHGILKLLNPTRESVFSAEEITHLTALYQQLNAHYTVQYVSPFYVYSGRVNFGGETLGSTLNNHSSILSSVLSAYWPIHGNDITVFDSGHISIGRVEFYFTHMVTLMNNNTCTTEVVHYTMASVQWMDHHNHSSRYGVSAVVCANFSRERSLCSYIPILRIAGKCASCHLSLDDETVFVAIPIPLKLCI